MRCFCRDGWYKMNNMSIVARRPKRQSTVIKAQLKKDELIADLIETRRKILDITSSFPPAKHDEVFLGIWSVKDLLAHLIGWDATNRQAVKAIRMGKLPDFYAYIDRDWQTYKCPPSAETQTWWLGGAYLSNADFPSKAHRLTPGHSCRRIRTGQGRAIQGL